MKTEVYSWRIDAATKTRIEDAARRENISVAALLERITKEWIEAKQGRGGDEAEQRRLHARVEKTFGTISGKDPNRAQQARRSVQNRLKRRYER